MTDRSRVSGVPASRNQVVWQDDITADHRLVGETTVRMGDYVLQASYKRESGGDVDAESGALTNPQSWVDVTLNVSGKRYKSVASEKKRFKSPQEAKAYVENYVRNFTPPVSDGASKQAAMSASRLNKGPYPPVKVKAIGDPETHLVLTDASGRTVTLTDDDDVIDVMEALTEADADRLGAGKTITTTELPDVYFEKGATMTALPAHLQIMKMQAESETDPIQKAAKALAYAQALEKATVDYMSDSMIVGSVESTVEEATRAGQAAADVIKALNDFASVGPDARRGKLTNAKSAAKELENTANGVLNGLRELTGDEMVEHKAQEPDDIQKAINALPISEITKVEKFGQQLLVAAKKPDENMIGQIIGNMRRLGQGLYDQIVGKLASLLRMGDMQGILGIANQLVTAGKAQDAGMHKADSDVYGAYRILHRSMSDLSDIAVELINAENDAPAEDKAEYAACHQTIETLIHQMESLAEKWRGKLPEDLRLAQGDNMGKRMGWEPSNLVKDGWWRMIRSGKNQRQALVKPDGDGWALDIRDTDGGNVLQTIPVSAREMDEAMRWADKWMRENQTQIV